MPALIFGSTCQRSEVEVKLHSNDNEMSSWPEGSDVCVCVCVCLHTRLLIHFYVHFSLFILMYVTSIF